jgi:hypothetical protein
LLDGLLGPRCALLDTLLSAGQFRFALGGHFIDLRSSIVDNHVHTRRGFIYGGLNPRCLLIDGGFGPCQRLVYCPFDHGLAAGKLFIDGLGQDRLAGGQELLLVLPHQTIAINLELR